MDERNIAIARVITELNCENIDLIKNVIVLARVEIIDGFLLSHFGELFTSYGSDKFEAVFKERLENYIEIEEAKQND